MSTFCHFLCHCLHSTLNNFFIILTICHYIFWFICFIWQSLFIVIVVFFVVIVFVIHSIVLSITGVVIFSIITLICLFVIQWYNRRFLSLADFVIFSWNRGEFCLIVFHYFVTFVIRSFCFCYYHHLCCDWFYFYHYFDFFFLFKSFCHLMSFTVFVIFFWCNFFYCHSSFYVIPHLFVV